MAYRLGKNRPVLDDRTMRFASYVKPALPSPPATVSYGAKVDSWPMYYNDQYGDCTCAAAGHMIQNWTANASAEITVPPPSVLSFYEHFVGTPPPPDKGCDMLSVLKYWRRDGIDRHKVLAFTSIDLQNQAQAQSACWLFGSIYIGWRCRTSPCRPTSIRSPFRGWSRRAARSATPRRTRTTATASPPCPMTRTISTS